MFVQGRRCNKFPLRNKLYFFFSLDYLQSISELNSVFKNIPILIIPIFFVKQSAFILQTIIVVIILQGKITPHDLNVPILMRGKMNIYYPNSCLNIILLEWNYYCLKFGCNLSRLLGNFAKWVLMFPRSDTFRLYSLMFIKILQIN